jgi:hypothetical protein
MSAVTKRTVSGCDYQDSQAADSSGAWVFRQRRVSGCGGEALTTTGELTDQGRTGAV